MKSIKSKMIIFLGSLIGAICIGLGAVSFINSSKALDSNLGKNLPKIAEQTASNIQGRIEGHLDSLESIAARAEIKSPNNSVEIKMTILLDEGKRIGSISRLINEISKNTDVIVQDSVEMDDELINQVKIINSSIISFKKIIEAVNEVIPKIQTVKNSAESIDKDKNDILVRIDGVSSVSLEVSASSQEISASSEEMNASTEEVAVSSQILSTMTEEMLEEVNTFKI